MGNTVLATILIITLAVGYVEERTVVEPYQETTPQQQNTPEYTYEIQEDREELIDDDAYMGNLNAPVVMVEFSDYVCYYCKKYFSETFPEIKREYIDTGKVLYVFRNLALTNNKFCHPMALAVECAGEEGDDKYFAMHEEMLSMTELWEPNIWNSAEVIGIDKENFMDCYRNGKLYEEIENDRQFASKIGISGTPAFIINNKVVLGNQSLETFRSTIEEELSLEKD